MIKITKLLNKSIIKSKPFTTFVFITSIAIFTLVILQFSNSLVNAQSINNGDCAVTGLDLNNTSIQFTEKFNCTDVLTFEEKGTSGKYEKKITISCGGQNKKVYLEQKDLRFKSKVGSTIELDCSGLNSNIKEADEKNTSKDVTKPDSTKTGGTTAKPTAPPKANDKNYIGESFGCTIEVPNISLTNVMKISEFLPPIPEKCGLDEQGRAIPLNPALIGVVLVRGYGAMVSALIYIGVGIIVISGLQWTWGGFNDGAIAQAKRNLRDYGTALVVVFTIHLVISAILSVIGGTGVVTDFSSFFGTASK